MRNNIFDQLWHKSLGRPYRLHKAVDNGSGSLVVLLHGIGQTGQVWHHLVQALQGLPVRVVAFDLLGFGDSPKPAWPDYNVDDHVNAVINSIERLHPKQPVIVVGHSMGCLVAVRLGLLRPDLVRHLILYEMPLYKGLPNRRYYRMRLNFYQRLYNWIVQYEPTFNNDNVKFSERIARKFTGWEVNQDNWQAFVKSLRHTIFEQTAPEDIQLVTTPMDVVYGSLDMLVIRGTVRDVISADTTKLNIHTVRAGHRVTRKASKFLRSRIESVLAEKPLEAQEAETISSKDQPRKTK